ncbi:hypothetical protein JJB07_14595 [Tumebacillus sp. ITR2]|uniref:Uncharacterized protein n=1 Tax=Tumebacillus amylolyticus TaxID=2801339 RepID=A0ABS1JC70_9BACL|nr:hypothetical protein [Tumebacillus amylolyticus]MBL0387867.1 hypothetical protein [Tumebacillus amylolyticus]
MEGFVQVAIALQQNPPGNCIICGAAAKVLVFGPSQVRVKFCKPCQQVVSEMLVTDLDGQVDWPDSEDEEPDDDHDGLDDIDYEDEGE